MHSKQIGILIKQRYANYVPQDNKNSSRRGIIRTPSTQKQQGTDESPQDT